MKTSTLAVLGAALGFALLLTGCDSDNASARTQEKSAAYAALKPWQKKYIERGDIATGFTPDMVYMAIGRASKVKPVEPGAGGANEIWTYSNFYVPANATHYRPVDKEVAKSYEAASTSAGGGAQSNTVSGNARSGGAVVTGSMEPADLPAATLNVTFHDGKVVKIELTRN